MVDLLDDEPRPEARLGVLQTDYRQAGANPKARMKLVPPGADDQHGAAESRALQPGASMRLVTSIAAATFVIGVACSGTAPDASVVLPALPVLAPATLVSAAPADTVVRAATLAEQQSGYRFTFEMSLQGLPASGVSGFSVSGTGAVDQTADRSTMALDLSGLRDLLLASGDASAAELDAFLGNGQIEVVQDGSTVYLRMPFITQQLRARTPWVAATVPEAATQAGGLGALGAWSGLGGLGSAGSPADYLAQIKTLDPSVRERGGDEIRGVQATRYSGSLDVRSLLSAQLSPAEAAQLNTAMPALDAFRIPYDVWVDVDGLPRRITTTLDFGALGGPSATGATPGMVFSYDLFDYGSLGEIVLPPEGLVTVVDPAALDALK